jgi:hypothetical protein
MYGEMAHAKSSDVTMKKIGDAFRVLKELSGKEGVVALCLSVLEHQIRSAAIGVML